MSLHMNLKQRILALTAMAVLLPMALFCAYMMTFQKNAYLFTEDRALTRQAMLISDGIDATYFSYLNSEIQYFMEIRSQISKLSSVLGDLGANARDAGGQALIQSFIASSEERFKVKAYLTGRGPGPRIPPALLNETDTTGKPLFAILKDAERDGRTGTYFLKGISSVAAVSPTGVQGRLAVLLRDVSDLKEQYGRGGEQVLSGIKIIIDSISERVAGRYVLISDREGKVLIGDDALCPAIPAFDPAAFKIPAGGRYGVELNGRDFLIKTSDFGPFEWKVVCLSDRNEVLAPLYRTLFHILLIALAILAPALAAAAFLVSRLVRPLRQVADAALEISRADPSDPATILAAAQALPEDGSETGMVASAIRHMARSLNDSISSAMRTQARQKLLEGELSAAAEIQSGMLPKVPSFETSCPFEIAAYLLPAKEVGGDLFDNIQDHESLTLVIGDVSGKGVPAALFMTTTVTIIRQCIGLGMEPAATMNRVNAMLSEHNPNLMFVTLLIITVSKKDGFLRYANAGHCRPMICKDGGIMELEGLSGPACGVVEGYEFKQFEGALAKGDRLVIYTDGISEAMDAKGELYGEEALRKVVLEHRDSGASDLNQAILASVAAHRGSAEQSDDITLLSVACR